MIWNVPSLPVAPPVPPCAKHVRPGSGGAWPQVTKNQSGQAFPTQNPCRDRPPERPWYRQRGVLRGKPSPAGPGRRHQSVLTEEKRPEAFPSEGKAGCWICPRPQGRPSANHSTTVINPVCAFHGEGRPMRPSDPTSATRPTRARIATVMRWPGSLERMVKHHGNSFLSARYACKSQPRFPQSSTSSSTLG